MNNPTSWLNIIWKADLTPFAKLIAAYLRRFMNDDKDIAYPSLNRMMRETGLSKPTVLKHIQLLIDQNLLYKKSGTCVTSNRYKMNIPDHYYQEYEEQRKLEAAKFMASSGGGKGDLPPKEGGGKGALLGSKGALPGVVKELYPNKQSLSKQSNNNNIYTDPEIEETVQQEKVDRDEYMDNIFKSGSSKRITNSQSFNGKIPVTEDWIPDQNIFEVKIRLKPDLQKAFKSHPKAFEIALNEFRTNQVENFPDSERTPAAWITAFLNRVQRNARFKTDGTVFLNYPELTTEFYKQNPIGAKLNAGSHKSVNPENRDQERNQRIIDRLKRLED